MDRKAATSGVMLLLLAAALVATQFVNSEYALSGEVTRGTRGGTRGGGAPSGGQLQIQLPPAPTCTDVIKNGLETDLDCGGPTCPKCIVGKSCISNLDCSSGLCQNAVCQSTPAVQQPTCTDGVKNGVETGVDCGGSCVTKCANGVSCGVNTDCASTNCVNGLCQALPTCTDGVKNAQESDIDCGGLVCPKCGLSKTCSSGVDCSTAQCQNNRCCVSNVGSSCACNTCGSCGGTIRCDGSCSGSTPSLPSGVDSQCRPLCSGTDINQQAQPCGGTCTPKCEIGKLCQSDNDCLFAVSYSSGAEGATCMFSPHDGKQRCMYCEPPRSQKFLSGRNTFFEGNFVQEYQLPLPVARPFAIINGVTLGPVNFVTFGPGGQCLWFSLRQAVTGQELALQNPSIHTEDYTSQNVEIQNRRNKIATSVLLRGAFYNFASNCPAQVQDFTVNYRACSI